MARLRRRWRVAKWALLICFLANVSIWAVSSFYRCRYGINVGLQYVEVMFVSNGFDFMTLPWAEAPALGQMIGDTYSTGWRITREPCRPLSLRWGGGRCVVGTGWGFTFPLFLPMALLGALTGYLFWRDRRCIPPHCCQACSYDLTGNTSGVCPECGATTNSE